MKIPILAVAALTVMATSAHAYTVSSSATLPSNPTAPIPTSFSPVVLFPLTGSNLTASPANPYTYRSPFENTKEPNAPFTSIEGSGSALFNFTAPAGRNLNTLTLIWGSPDKFNELKIFSGVNGTGSQLADIKGDNAGITPYGTNPVGSDTHPVVGRGFGYSFVKISGLSNFRSIRLYNNPKDNAFEISTISAVPLPAAAPLFGLALAVMGGFGFFKRKKAAARAA